MRGLLLKDWLVIARQAKLYFVMMIVFALVPQMGIYSIFFGALLPITAFAYDERSRWDNMARMMPYSSGDVVAGKYVFGYLAVGAVALLETAVQGVYCLTGINFFGFGESMQWILIPTAAALSVLALQIPIVFWIGTEKARTVLIFFTILVMMALQAVLVDAGGSADRIFAVEVGADRIPPIWNLPGILLVLGTVVILQIFSLWVSKKLYQRHWGRKG